MIQAHRFCSVLLGHGYVPLASSYTRYASHTPLSSYIRLYPRATHSQTLSSHALLPSHHLCYTHMLHRSRFLSFVVIVPTVVSVFIYQRFSNLPLELVGALHSNLEEDLGWSQQMHESEDGVVAGKDCSSDKSEFRSLQVGDK